MVRPLGDRELAQGILGPSVVVTCEQLDSGLVPGVTNYVDLAELVSWRISRQLPLSGMRDLVVLLPSLRGCLFNFFTYALDDRDAEEIGSALGTSTRAPDLNELSTTLVALWVSLRSGNRVIDLRGGTEIHSKLLRAFSQPMSRTGLPAIQGRVKVEPSSPGVSATPEAAKKVAPWWMTAVEEWAPEVVWFRGEISEASPDAGAQRSVIPDYGVLELASQRLFGGADPSVNWVRQLRLMHAELGPGRRYSVGAMPPPAVEYLLFGDLAGLERLSVEELMTFMMCSGGEGTPSRRLTAQDDPLKGLADSLGFLWKG